MLGCKEHTRAKSSATGKSSMAKSESAAQHHLVSHGWQQHEFFLHPWPAKRRHRSAFRFRRVLIDDIRCLIPRESKDQTAQQQASAKFSYHSVCDFPGYANQPGCRSQVTNCFIDGCCPVASTLIR